MVDYEQTVFISYAWGGESEKIVNQIDKALQQRGLKIIRDKRALGYMVSISEFMEQIGQGNCVIVVISDKYLRSPSCMLELIEIAELKQFHNRIFPIVLADANIYDPIKRIEYVKYWGVRRAELGEAMRSLDPANLQGIRNDMDLYDRIGDEVSGLSSTLKDMNTLAPEMHRDLDFSNIYTGIEKRIEEASSLLKSNVSKKDTAAAGKNNIKREPPIPPEVNENSKTDVDEKNFRVSVSFPLLLSKRFESVFLFQLYLPEDRSRANRNIGAYFHDQPKTEYIDQSRVRIGQKIQVECYSALFDFSKPVIKLIDGTITKIVFLGMPKDTCQPGTRNIRVSVSDIETQQEIDSFNVEVKVVDFVFDHVSRPTLSRASAVVLGIGSFAMFVLTLLEQIDKTVGLTSGTAIGALAVGIYASFHNLFQRISTNTP